jgi:tetratricopeptide (TPR) repeat protein
VDYSNTAERFSTGSLNRWCAALLGLASVFTVFSDAAALAKNRSRHEPAGITIQGTVRNSAGDRVAGATVLIRDVNSSTAAETRTNADGTFHLKVDHAGSYFLRARKADLHNRETLVTLSPGDKKQLDLIINTTDLTGSEPPPSSDSPRSARPSAGSLEFDDKPNFTVAGLTDWNNAGTHGSDVRVTTSEALAKETLALRSSDSIENSAGSSENAEKAEAHRQLGELDERRGDPLSAVREYEQAALLNPSERNYFEWGTELVLHKAAVPAAEVFTRGSAKYPSSSRMLAALGVALYASGSYDKAASRLCAASDLQPNDPAPYLLLGTMEKASAEPLPCSEQTLARFAKEQPDNAFANYYYALALWKKQRKSSSDGASPQVDSLLQKAVTINPKFGEAYVQLGIVKSEAGHVEQAIQAYAKALEVSPGLGEAHYRLSLAYKRKGDEAKAHQEFQRYEEIQKTEVAAIQRERRELRQFLVILKDERASP